MQCKVQLPIVCLGEIRVEHSQSNIIQEIKREEAVTNKTSRLTEAMNDCFIDVIEISYKSFLPLILIITRMIKWL
jgi:hypothetical protein